MVDIGITVALFTLIALVVIVMTVARLIIIVPPNRAAVITGRRRPLGSGQVVGYRTVIGGRTLRIPVVESVDHLSLETIPLEITVTNAYSKGNIPLNVQAIANVKIASEPETDFNNAVERLLGKTEQEIAGLAHETLMGNLRGVLAKMTPEQVNEDRLTFAEHLVEEAGEDLKKLGFKLDVLKIQNVTDEVGYLESIGRKKNAVVKKEAEVAEAENTSETRRRQAEYKREAEIAEADADIAIAEAANKLRVRRAELHREGETAERLAAVAAEQAEVKARRELEDRRAETERARLQADVIAPAEADRLAAEEAAKGAAAPIVERGRAQAEALEALFAKIGQGGEDGFRVFMAEKLPELLRVTADSVAGIDVARMVVMDGGDGHGLASAANQRVNAAVAMLENLAGTYGIDMDALFRALAARTGAAEAGADELAARLARDTVAKG
ncbi:MAG: flotillin family protein [Gemmatimonadota bacterium]